MDLFGGEVLDPKLNWPDLQQSWAGREIEMPNESSKVNQVREMNFFDKWRNPDAYASTSPTNIISLNRDLIEKEKQNLGDVLVHELAHVGQQDRGLLENFKKRFTDPNSLEDEAVNKEAMRNVRKKDIRLFPGRR